MSMQEPAPELLLLRHAQIVGIELDAAGALRAIHNPQVLATWLETDSEDGLPASRAALFESLFGPRSVQALAQGLESLRDATQVDLGVLPGRFARIGTPERQFAVALASLADGALLLIQDDSRQQGLLHELQDMRQRSETALAVLRAPPDALRLFLSSAMACVHAIRATLRMPARTQEALRDKLGRLRTEAVGLGTEAGSAGLAAVVDSCQSLADLAGLLQSRTGVSGDDLLPLAPRIDAIASAIGNCARIEEQRYEPSPAAAEPDRRRARRSAVWHEVSERRWSEFLRRRGQELGTLARLVMTGAEDVPQQHRRHVDEILAHLLKNAMDHGIETPEERLDCHKAASGRITVGFARGERGTMKMTVHDDGRGFDITRIGKAAVQSGLISDESLERRDAADVVGLIFKPTFSTEGVDSGEGQGRGMAYLRRKVTRMGGQISVATKAGRYTLFTIELPESDESDQDTGLPLAMP